MSLRISGETGMAEQLLEIKDKKPPVVKALFTTIFQHLKDSLGACVGKELLKTKFTSVDRIESEKWKQILTMSGRSQKLVVASDSPIDGMVIKPKMESDKFIVVFNGMGDRYEKHLEALAKLADDVGANIVTFNYVGVGESKGKAPTSAKDLVNDGKAVLNHVISLAKSKEDVLIYGHSMGGGIAAVVQQDFPNCAFASENTFKDFVSAVAVKKDKILAFIVDKLGWNFKTLRAVENMAPDNVLTIVNRQDPTVPYAKASLYKAQKENLKKAGIEDVAIHRIKVGSKTRKIGKDDIDVKITDKKFAKKEEAETIEEISPRKKEMGVYQSLKKKKLNRYLYHPHQRIMDRLLQDPPKIPKKVSTDDKKKLEDINAQFRKEDQVAYDAMVKCFQKFLKIEQEPIEKEPEVTIEA